MQEIKPQKRKTKSITPIVFSISKAESDKLKSWIRNSLLVIRSEHANVLSWTNICFRIKVGLEVARTLYEEVTVKEIQECLDVCLSLRERFEAPSGFSITPAELEHLEAAIDAIDEMQDNCTRRVFLDAHIVADKFMKALTKKA